MIMLYILAVIGGGIFAVTRVANASEVHSATNYMADQKPGAFVLSDDDHATLDVTDAKVLFDQRKSIAIRLTPQSARRFALFTQKNVGRVVNVLIDGNVVSSVRVAEPQLSGLMTIFGDFNFEQAWTTSLRLKSGAAVLAVSSTKH